MMMSWVRRRDARARLQGGRAHRLVAFLLAPTMLVTGLFVSGMVAPSAATAAGDAQLLVSVTPVDATTGNAITSVTSSQSPRRIAFRVDFSCVTSNCDNATVAFDPTQLDPNYNFYRLLYRTGFTPPASGGTVAGSDTAGWTVSLGNLAAGASGQFTLEYGWQDLGQSSGSPERQDLGFANFPNGFPITQTVRGNADTAVGERTATSDPVTWQIPTGTPTIGITGLSTPATGFFTTDTNITYQLHMATGCKNDSNRFTYDFQCSSAYTVTHQLPPGAVFVSADGNPTVTGTVATGLILTWTGPAWASSGNTSLVGWAADPHNITIQFPRANIAPPGQACDFTTQFGGPTGRVDTTYISMPGVPGATASATLPQFGPFPIKCTDPFPRASASPKLSTFDGASRESATVSPVVIPAVGGATNQKEWDVTVSNTANIPGVAVVTDNSLDLKDMPVYQIIAPAQSTIAWTATDGTTTQSGTSVGTANAPTGFRFVTSTVTSPPLAPPNQIVEQNGHTDFTVRYLYQVSPGATPGTAGHTNTATAVMQWPDYPQFTDTSLSITPHTVDLVAPFARMASGKFADTFLANPLGAQRYTGQNLNVPIPASGTQRIFRWNAVVANTGNAPGIPTVVDTHLGDDPDLPITSVSTGVRAGSPPPAIQSGSLTQNVPFTMTYTLDDGTIGTYSGTGYTAPAGRRIVSATVTGQRLNGGSTRTSDNTSNQLEVYFEGLMLPTAKRDSYATNTFDGTMDYAISGLGTLTGGGTSTVHLLGVPPTITATMGQPQIAGGASQATTTTDVTFTVCGSTADGGTDHVPFTPEYVFMAPAGWNITSGSASFPAGSVPAGVTFTYNTVTVGGVSRNVAVASWPAGTTWGINTTLPCMSVVARPGGSVPAGTTSVARGFIGNTGLVQAADTFTNEFTDTPDIDSNSSTMRFSEATPGAGVAVGAVAAMQVLKEICYPDASQPDGCRWYSDPNNKVGVPPNSTSIKYRISVTNTGNSNLSDIVGYDVLPYAGDTGTSTATMGTPRGSTFLETISSVTTPTNGAQATYSFSTQPCRPEVATVITCANDWSSTSSGAQAIRLVRPGTLAPGQSFSMVYDAAVNNAPGFGAVACNSFAVKATGLSLASEPAPVCASVEETDLAVTAGTPRVQSGRPGVLPWTVTNNGGAPSSPATVTLQVPAGLTVTSFTPAGWTCTAVDGNGNQVFGTAIGPTTLTCTATGNLLKNVPVALNLPVIPTTTNRLTATADVAGPLFDGNLGNNHAVMTVNATPAPGNIGLTKTDGVTTAHPGDVLTYTITATNPLDFEVLHGATLTDSLPGRVTFVSASDGGTESGGTVTWALPDIPPDGTITRTVTVKVASTINTATLTNTANVSVPDPAFPSQTLTGTAQDIDQVVTNPSISLTKTTASPTYAAVGDVVEYTFTVTNTGDVTLSPVTVSDPLPGLSALTWTGPAGPVTLAPGQTATATASYTITQADLDATKVTNTATASGTAPSGSNVTSTASATVTSTATPHITVTKTATGTVSRAGDVVTFTIDVLNDGPLTLQNVRITDLLPALGPLSYQWPGTAGTLAPGQKLTATATYTDRQSDIDAGRIVNTATGYGTTLGGVTVQDDGTVTVPITRAPALSLHKTVVYAPGTRGEAGQQLDYRFTVTNTGNETLTNVSLSDALPGLFGLTYDAWPGTPGVLAPGQVVTATAHYLVTQQDVDGGAGVTNHATVTGTDPVGTAVTANDSVTIPTPANANLQIVKTGHIVGHTPVAPGDTVQYRFQVTNIGVLTLHDVVLVDPKPGLSAIVPVWPGTPGILAPGETVTGTASYTLTQADIDAGTVVNTATTDGLTPQDAPVTDDDTLTIVVPAAPAIRVVKDSTTTAVTHVGQVVPYTFAVTNTGNVTLSSISIDDQLAAPSTTATLSEMSCPSGPLAPGASVTCTASYTATQADLDNGVISDTATASGDAPAGTAVTSPPSPKEIPVVQTPAVTIVKASTTSTVTDLGQQIPYTFTVTNTGNVTLTNVAVTDTVTSPSTPANLTAVSCPAGTLAPGTAMTCTATYTVTQADLDNGTVNDQAIAQGTLRPTAINPTPRPVVTGPSPVTIVVGATPSLTLVKASPTQSVTSVGQRVPYTFTVTNTGNVTLTGITVTDVLVAPSLLSDLDGPFCATATLAPGDSVVCTATYTVSQSDIDNGSINDHATAAGTPPTTAAVPNPQPIVTPRSSVSIQVVQTAGLTIEKKTTTTAATMAGQKIPYTFLVTNTGNTTVRNIHVTDTVAAPSLQTNLSPVWCPADALPGGASMVCTATYTVAAADLNSGALSDTAIADGDPANGTPVTSNRSTLTITAVDPKVDLPVVSG
jgi:uncharacterized repeat protein (TIGR01451 family)